MRRDFLKWCATAGLGLAVPGSFPKLLTAEDDKDLPVYDGPYYIVCNASGGWDTTYLMDPKGVGGINRLYKEGDILTEGQIRFAPTAKHISEGMSNEDFFAKYAKELLVLNGLDYSVNNHSPCSRYMATGNLDSLAYPTFAALVAACRGKNCPLAFLTFGNYSATGNLVAMARVPYIPSLKLLANADGVHGNARSLYHDAFVTDRIEQALAEQNDRREALPLLPRRAGGEHALCRPVEFAGPRAGHASYPERHPQGSALTAGGDRAGLVQGGRVRVGEFDDRPVRQPSKKR